MIFGLVVGRLQVLVARVNAQSVELADQADRLQVLASSDGLTGLVNRRTWDDMLTDGLERAGRHHRTATVEIIDVDHFKKYNDSPGPTPPSTRPRTPAATGP